MLKIKNRTVILSQTYRQQGDAAMTTLTLTAHDISNLTAQDVAALAGRLEQDDYVNPFEALKDWHLLRAIAFQRQELAEPYLYLLDIEAYDEA